MDSQILKELESISEEELINLIKAHKDYLALLENEHVGFQSNQNKQNEQKGEVPGLGD